MKAIERVKTYIKDYFTAPGFKKKFLIMIIGVFFMGFFLSFLINCNYGTDPCTFMNLTISRRLGVLLGTWQALLNIVLIVIVIWRKPGIIGPGTIANMFLIGYIADFFCFLWSKVIPASAFTNIPSRIIIFAVALAGFIISCSLYMNADMGVAPYDGIPVIINEQIFPKVPFKYIRIIFDLSVIVIGCLAGGTPNPGILIMAFALGPTISVVGKFLKNKIL
ncbi:MAG: hypothetical protein K6B41_01760 [Butyrivibrio sp.]|nr:hypothetical protein [Butyrivibrio sp.]